MVLAGSGRDPGVDKVDPEEVDAALIALGASSADVAESLASYSIRGDRKRPCACPLAEFVMRLGVEPPVNVHTGKNMDGELGLVWWTVRDPKTGETYRRQVRLSQGCEDFAREFDDGKWPRLDRNVPGAFYSVP